MPAGMFALIGLLLLLILWPLILMETMVVVLGKLGISPFVGLSIVVSLFVGGLINLPIKRLPAHEDIFDHRWALYGLDRWLLDSLRRPSETIIAVNVGGCIVPLLLATYELVWLFLSGGLWAALIAVLINIVVCFKFSCLKPGRGIVIPVLLPGLTAALCGLMIYPENSPAVAFCAGVLGPLIGADLLRIRQIGGAGMGVVSIGGAGTFDGIVISGFIALLLS